MSIFIALLVLAVLAFFLVKYVLGKASEQDSSASASQMEDSNSASGNSAKLAGSQTSESSTSHDSASNSQTTQNSTSHDSASNSQTAQNSTGFGATSNSQTAQNSTGHSSASSSLTDLGVDTGDTLHDVREMVKILNLAPSDASRLSISRETFSAIRGGDSVQTASEDELRMAANKLRHMLA